MCRNQRLIYSTTNHIIYGIDSARMNNRFCRRVAQRSGSLEDYEGPRRSAASFGEAYDQAVRRFGDAWFTLPLTDRTAAIYREMRSLDAERFGVQPFDPRRMQPFARRRKAQAAAA